MKPEPRFITFGGNSVRVDLVATVRWFPKKTVTSSGIFIPPSVVVDLDQGGSVVVEYCTDAEARAVADKIAELLDAEAVTVPLDTLDLAAAEHRAADRVATLATPKDGLHLVAAEDIAPGEAISAWDGMAERHRESNSALPVATAAGHIEAGATLRIADGLATVATRPECPGSCPTGNGCQR